MQITLTEREIHAALRKYIIARLRLSADEEITVDLMATRGVDGFKAMLDIIEPDEKETVIPTVPEKVQTATVAFVAEPKVKTVTTEEVVAQVTKEPVPEKEVAESKPVEDTQAKPQARVSGLFAHLAGDVPY